METFELITLLAGIFMGMGMLLLIAAAIVAYFLGEME